MPCLPCGFYIHAKIETYTKVYSLVAARTGTEVGRLADYIAECSFANEADVLVVFGQRSTALVVLMRFVSPVGFIAQLGCHADLFVFCRRSETLIPIMSAARSSIFDVASRNSSGFIDFSPMLVGVIIRTTFPSITANLKSL